MMSLHKKDLLSLREKNKDDYIQCRVNSEIKKILKRFAEREEKSLTQFILDTVINVITDNESVLTNTNGRDNCNDKYKIALKQLISLFDKIFALDLPNSLKKRIRPILTENVDINLIEEIKEELL